MSEHTPGPWQARHEPDGEGPAWIIETQPYADDVCGIHTDSADDAANARLICAAPDLLAACEALLHNMQQHSCPGCHIEKAREAVRKAKGG